MCSTVIWHQVSKEILGFCAECSRGMPYHWARCWVKGKEVVGSEQAGEKCELKQAVVASVSHYGLE